MLPRAIYRVENPRSERSARGRARRTRPDQRAHLAGYARAADRTRSSRSAITTPRGRSRARGRARRARVHDLDDLLADDRVISVDLALPHHVHFPAARAALAAGQARARREAACRPRRTECRALIEQAEAGGLSLGVAENTRFVAAYQAVERLCVPARLGEPRLARTLISGSEVRRLSDPTLWKGRQDGSGGGAIIDAGPHSFYLLRWLVGELATVRGFHHRLVPESEVDDHAVVAGRFASGALYTTEYTFTAEIPWGERLELYGSEGSIIVDQLSHTPAMHYRGGDDLDGTPLDGRRVQPTRLEGRIDRGRRGRLRRRRARGPAADRVRRRRAARRARRRARLRVGGRAGGIELEIDGEGPLMSGRLLYVTDVSPYAATPADEPARAPRGRARRARASRRSPWPSSRAPPGLELRPRPRASPRCVRARSKDATCSRSSRSATRPGRPTSARRSRRACAAASSRSSRCIPPPTRRAAGRVRRSCSAPASTGIPGRSASRSRSPTANIRRPRNLPADWHFTDELYLFRDLRSDARVLLRAPGDDLDMSSPRGAAPRDRLPAGVVLLGGRRARLLHRPRPLPIGL